MGSDQIIGDYTMSSGRRYSWIYWYFIRCLYKCIGEEV